MPRTISYDFGDVVLVPFPFTDQSASKQRPAVVVSSLTFHRQSSDIIVAAITTRPRPWSSLEVAITQWQEAGLLYASVIKPIIAAIDRRLVVKRLGRLEEQDKAALRSALAALLG